MNIVTTTFDRLTEDEIAVWSEIQRAEPALSSPYFRPEFTQAVSAVRNDVEVAVLKNENEPIGFLPFQRSRPNVGHPAGGILSDFHGLIAPSNVSCDAVELLQGCRLSAWHFDHLVSEQRNFSAFVCSEADSPYVDLSDGLDAYLARRRHGSHIMSEYGQKSRKISREIGPIRFEPHVVDKALLATLFAWKGDQIRRRRMPNVFDYTWVRALITKISDYNSKEFSAVMSVVYAGDTVAAIDFGMRSGQVLHSWFPVYNAELARYSPGLLCWVETMKAAESLGIRRIDFGKGTESFKYRLMSGITRVGQGTADVRPGAAMARRACWKVRDLIRKSYLATPARVMSNNVRRARHWLGTRISNVEYSR